MKIIKWFKNLFADKFWIEETGDGCDIQVKTDIYVKDNRVLLILEDED